MQRTLNLFMCTCVLAIIFAGATLAQPVSSRHGMGPYFGIGSDPDQFLLGGQMILGSTGSPVHFSPAVDFGFGDNVDVATLNFDITHDFFPSEGRMALIVGAGPTVAFYSSDRFDDNTEAGLTLVTGAKFPTRMGDSFNLGMRFGVGDIPDFKMTAAYIFGMH